MADQGKNILKQIWSKEDALKENLLLSSEAEPLFKSLLDYLDKYLLGDSIPGLKYRKLKTNPALRTWWTTSTGYPVDNPWSKIKPLLDLLEQFEAGKTIKERLETAGLFVETRSNGGDQTILVGRRDHTGEKTHIVIDDKTAEIRVEDTRKEPTDVLAKIETILTLPNGKKIKTTREAVEEISSGKMCVFEIETQKVSVGTPLKLKEGISGSFMVSIPILIRNHSNDKIRIRDVYTEFLVPEGYKKAQCFNFGLPANSVVEPRDILPCVIQFSTSITGDEAGASDGNPLWFQNKELILKNIPNAKTIFRIRAECIAVNATETIDETSDLSQTVMPKIWDGYKPSA